MKIFIQKPNLDRYPGIVVTKDTCLEYKNDHVIQTVKDLTYHSVTKIKGDGYKSKYDTVIKLKEGDVLIFENEERGYIKPVYSFVTIAEAIEELNSIIDLG